MENQSSFKQGSIPQKTKLGSSKKQAIDMNDFYRNSEAQSSHSSTFKTTIDSSQEEVHRGVRR